MLSNSLKRDLEELKEAFYQPQPNRFFEVGQRVELGSLEDVIVLEILDEGKYILVEYTNNTKNNSSEIKGKRTKRVVPWFKLYPEIEGTESFIKNKDLELDFLNTTIESALCKIYGDGINFEVAYQRDYCWSLEDKIALIDSIFNRVDIGKIVLANRDILEPWEVIDGKQRLSSIKDFYEDKFEYQGKKYSQLPKKDRTYFKDYKLPTGILDTSDKDVIIRQFIRLNTCGKSMNKEDIQKAHQLLIDNK